jgi:hypothetical protein
LGMCSIILIWWDNWKFFHLTTAKFKEAFARTM